MGEAALATVRNNASVRIGIPFPEGPSTLKVVPANTLMTTTLEHYRCEPSLP